MTVKTAKKYTAMKMFLKVFIVINVLPILIFFFNKSIQKTTTTKPTRCLCGCGLQHACDVRLLHAMRACHFGRSQCRSWLKIATLSTSWMGRKVFSEIVWIWVYFQQAKKVKTNHFSKINVSPRRFFTPFPLLPKSISSPRSKLWLVVFFACSCLL